MLAAHTQHSKRELNQKELAAKKAKKEFFVFGTFGNRTLVIRHKTAQRPSALPSELLEPFMSRDKIIAFT